MHICGSFFWRGVCSLKMNDCKASWRFMSGTHTHIRGRHDAVAVDGQRFTKGRFTVSIRARCSTRLGLILRRPRCWLPGSIRGVHLPAAPCCIPRHQAGGERGTGRVDESDAGRFSEHFRLDYGANCCAALRVLSFGLRAQHAQHVIWYRTPSSGLGFCRLQAGCGPACPRQRQLSADEPIVRPPPTQQPAGGVSRHTGRRENRPALPPSSLSRELFSPHPCVWIGLPCLLHFRR